ncbi:SRPBCC family protein [Paenibacillus sp. PR3]|uniref:SRPBCC family protein n=1 Tax=Paenibacillus terricola TaxID=2763503 RepID=A0ABR8MX83_9BACL|nr:SRPBCC family protein [Paenibacillus terricola]MBD3920493.1 SRPBCC family protein [Paenibacillus terricola]
MTSVVGQNEIITARQFDVPKERVYEAWTTPELLARWWGPNGFTNTFHEFDPRPGGDWRFIMHGPDGVDYPNHNTFVELVPHERIVLRHNETPEFQVTATFEDADGGTLVTFRQLFKSAEVFEQVKAYCIDGNEQNFDRLETLLRNE